MLLAAADVDLASCCRGKERRAAGRCCFCCFCFLLPARDSAASAVLICAGDGGRGAG